ncbi:MAG: hypothetical protein AAF901_02515 [Bacteroidota bacterium]
MNFKPIRSFRFLSLMSKKFLFSAMVIALGICSCSEDLDSIENTLPESTFSTSEMMRISEDEKPDFHSKIILGKKLKNPYSVTHMQAAFDYYNRHVTDSPFKKTRVRTTHYYIKILPTTEEHLIALDNLDNSDDDSAPILDDYPLDYEILEEGDYYVEPKDVNDLYYPAYTVIPVGYQLPNNLPYEIIEHLYYPEKEFDVETCALFFADWKDELEADNIFVTEETLPRYLNRSPEEDTDTRLFGRRYRPKGYVKVKNTDNTIYEPLQKAKISIGRSFWWRYTYTNDDGYFSAPKKYRGKVRIRAKWRGHTATIRKTWNELLGFWVSDHLMTLKRKSNGRTKNINYTEPHDGIFGTDLRGGHLWFKGTVHNGLRKYVDYCNAKGINKTISFANVWAFSRGGASSTPMLKRYAILPQMATLAGVGQSNFWHVMTQSLSGSAISFVPSWLRPDQIYQGLRDKKIRNTGPSNTMRVHQLVFHESGHYSHAVKAGPLFWANVFATELSNEIFEGSPYADGSKPSFRAGARIGLAEGWGTFTEFKVTNFYYGKSYISAQGYSSGFYSATTTGNTPSIERFMENFDIYDRPMSDQRLDDKSWFLHGLMWDLLDNQTEITNPVTGNSFSERYSTSGVRLNHIVDNINIGTGDEFNLSFVFNALNGNVHNA